MIGVTSNSISKGKMVKNKRRKKSTKKLFIKKIRKDITQHDTDPSCTWNKENLYFFQKKMQKMREKCCIFLHFENAFLELITINLIFMQNLKKIFSKMKAWNPLENLCHLRGNLQLSNRISQKSKIFSIFDANQLNSA